MAKKKDIPPFSGINIVREDAALEVGGKSPSLYVRDAVNVDFTESGRIELRHGMQLESTHALKYLWQSPLHKDCFALLNDHWVKFDPNTWEYEILAIAGHAPIFHTTLNNKVCMSCEAGLFIYDGIQATRLTLDTPAKPYSTTQEDGSLTEGGYAFAIAWMMGGLESALSEIDKIEVTHNSAVQIQFPMCLDHRVTHIRLYMTEPGGIELRQVADYPISIISTHIVALPELGRAAQFQYLSPMQSGQFLRLWRGRLLVARSNVLHYSEAMTYHLTDERYNFIQFPQRISFIEPVDGGIWVGQTSHVVFLRGDDVRGLVMENKASRAPIVGSSNLLHSDVVGGELSQGGMWSAVWLAENGFVLGTASGQIVELHANAMKGITAKSGSLVGFDKRVIAVVR